MKYRGKGKKIVLVLLIVTVVATVFGLVVMLLWNWLVPDLFNGPVITFWQALGLLVLSKLLLGGFWRKGGDHWKHKWKHKMAHMSPDQKERFKERFMCKWGKGAPHGQEEPSQTVTKVQ